MLTAVTGGIAEGKSTVLGFLSEMGFMTLSADAVARQLFQDPTVNGMLAQAAGTTAPIVPEQLAQAIFEDGVVRRAVNRIMHPRIMDRIRRSSAEFVEIPLLIETCLQGEFDRVWVVTCGPEEQRKRLTDRYGANFDVESALRAQLPTAAKMPFADAVIRTNCAPETVRRNVSFALQCRFEIG